MIDLKKNHEEEIAKGKQENNKIKEDFTEQMEGIKARNIQELKQTREE